MLPAGINLLSATIQHWESRTISLFNFFRRRLENRPRSSSQICLFTLAKERTFTGGTVYFMSCRLGIKDLTLPVSKTSGMLFPRSEIEAHKSLPVNARALE